MKKVIKVILVMILGIYCSSASASNLENRIYEQLKSKYEQSISDPEADYQSFTSFLKNTIALGEETSDKIKFKVNVQEYDDGSIESFTDDCYLLKESSEVFCESFWYYEG